MHRMTRLKITDVNQHLICALCSGYLVDATTIIECLHSFCRTCIVRYLESSKFCPICDVLVHKTRPHLNIRPDKTLQDMVYKLVPGLFKEEMKRRREFYKANPTNAIAGRMNEREERGEVEESERGYELVHNHDNKAEEEEKISLCLQHCSTLPVDQDGVLILSNINTDEKDCDKRYLNCPAGFTMGGIKKFIRIKFDLSSHMNIELFHMDETLKNEYTLMDVAYIYAWRRLEPLKLYYIVYDSLKQKVQLPKPENLPIPEEAPRYVGKKRGRKRKHPLEDPSPAVVPSTSAAIAAALGKDMEDVGPELTPAETATSASSTADSSSSSSSEESDQSESEEEIDVINGTGDVHNGVPEQEPPPEKKSKGDASPDGIIKRGNFEAVRSHLMNGDYGKKGLHVLSPAPGRTPLSSREFVVKKKKVETTDIALDPMDDFDMDGPGIILFPSKTASAANAVGSKDKTVVAKPVVTVNGTAATKKVIKVNGFTTASVNANGIVATNGDKTKAVNKLNVPRDSQSSITANGNSAAKPELMRTHSKEHAYSKSKEPQQKVNGKENSIRLNGKEPSLGKNRRDSSSTSPKAKVKESSHKSPKDPQHSSKSSSKEPTPPKGYLSKDSSPKDSSPKTLVNGSSPGNDSGSDKADKPLKIKIKCDTSMMDKKNGGGERKSSLSPRSYVITSSTTPPEREPANPVNGGGGGGGSKKSSLGSEGGSGGHKRSRSSSSDGGKSKDRRSGSLGRTSGGGDVTHHYVTKLSPGTESGKSPPSQREPIKMIITKSQISPPLKTQISPPLKNPISPPLPLKAQLSPPLRLKISTVDPNQVEPKTVENNSHATVDSGAVLIPQSDSKVVQEDSVKTNMVNGIGETNADKCVADVKATETDTPSNVSPPQQVSLSQQVSPSQVSPPQSKPGQPAKKVDKRKSLEDKVFQLHKAKQNEQLQLLNRSTSINVTPSAVTTVSDGTVSTTDPYHFSDTDTSLPNGNMNVKMESQTKIKIKKDMGTSPSAPEGLGGLEHKKPPVVTGQRLLKPQPQPGKKQALNVPVSGFGSPFIPATPNLAKVLAQGKQATQKPDSTTGDHKMTADETLLLQQLQQKQLIMLQQQRMVAALQQQQLTPQQKLMLQQQQAIIQQQLQSPPSSTTTGGTPQLHRSLSLQNSKPAKPAQLPLSPLRAMHKLPTLAPTSPVGGDHGKPQAKRPRIHSGGSANKVSPSGAPLHQLANQNNVIVNGILTHPGRPSSVPPQFPPGPFVNGVLGNATNNQHSPPNGPVAPAAAHGPILQPPSVPTGIRPPASHANTMVTPPTALAVRMAQPTNGLQNRYLNVFKDWCSQNPAKAHTSPPPPPPPPGHSPPAHMHRYPPSHANGHSPIPAHSTTPLAANGYDAPLELTTKKRTDSSSSDSKNNNTAPSEGTILKVPNLMSLKT